MTKVTIMNGMEAGTITDKGIFIPGFPADANLASITETGKVILDKMNIAKALIDKYDIISYNDSIYEYRDGIYHRSDKCIERDIVNISYSSDFKGSVKSITNEIKHIIKSSTTEFDYPFNMENHLIPTRDGVLCIDFETGDKKLLPHSPEYKFTFKLPVKYDPEAPTEEIEGVFRQYVAEEDLNVLYQIPAQAFLQAMGANPYKKIYLPTGLNDSGKSTYLETIGQMMGISERNKFGTKNVSHVDLISLLNDRFALVDLEDKLMNIYDDLSFIPLNEAGKIKNIIGTYEHRLERKTKDAYNGRIFAVHVFSCNHLPSLAAKVWRDKTFFPKVEIVQFNNKFEIDPTFKERVITDENISGLFNIVLDKMIQIKKEGKLLVDTSGEKTHQIWKWESSPILKFIKQNMYFDNEEITKYDKNTLFGIYKEFCDDEDIDIDNQPMSLTAFTKILKASNCFKEIDIGKKKGYGGFYKFKTDSKYVGERAPKEEYEW